METQIKKLDNGKKELTVNVSGEIVKNKFEEVFKKIGQEAKVPGFRAGHVPRDILEKNFSSNAHEQVLKELIPEIYNQAIEQEKIEVVALPEISDVKLDRANLSFRATVEVSPEIDLKSYKGMKVSYKKIEVAVDDIKRNLDSLKESRKLEAVDESVAKGLGYPSLAELERALEKQLYIQKENDQRQKIEHELIEAIIKDLNFHIPESLVERQTQDTLRQVKLDFAMKGVPREKIEGQEKELLKEIAPQARRQVKVYLVLAQIAKKEGIPVDDQMPSRVMELLLKEADWQEAA